MTDYGNRTRIQIRAIKAKKAKKNLKIIEDYYVKKNVSVSARENAIHSIHGMIGINVRSKGNTDGAVLGQVRYAKKVVAGY